MPELILQLKRDCVSGPFLVVVVSGTGVLAGQERLASYRAECNVVLQRTPVTVNNNIRYWEAGNIITNHYQPVLHTRQSATR